MSVNNAFAITFKVHPLTGLFYIIFHDSVNMTSLLSSTHGRRETNPSAVVLLTRYTALQKENSSAHFRFRKKNNMASAKNKH